MKPITYTAAEQRLSPGLCAKLYDANERVVLLEEELAMIEGTAVGMSYRTRQTFGDVAASIFENLGQFIVNATEPGYNEDVIRAWMDGLRCTLWGRGYDLFQEESRQALVEHILALLDELEAVREGTQK